MSEQGSTPGPWSIEAKGNEWLVTAPDPEDAPGEPPWKIATVHASVGYDTDESKPNAHLIQHAPDLLAMLQRVRETFGGMALETYGLGYDIDALIARATGQEVPR